MTQILVTLDEESTAQSIRRAIGMLRGCGFHLYL